MFTPGRTALLLVIVTATLYAPVLSYGFVYEDRQDLPTLFQPWQESLTIWLWKPARSLTALTFALTPPTPRAQHAINLGWHLLNGGLLYGVATALLRPWAAVVALGVFLLHPVQVESVAYVSSRADLLATTALLLGLLAVITSRGWLVALSCVLAFLAKETAIVAVPLLALFALWRGVRLPRPATALLAVVMVPPATYLLLTYPVVLDLSAALTQLAQWTRLLALVVWPVGLTIDHDWNWITVIPMSAVAGVWAWAVLVACLWPRSWTALAVGWCLITVAPRFVVPLVEGLHEHHLAVPMIVVSLLVGAVIGAEERYGVSASPA